MKRKITKAACWIALQILKIPAKAMLSLLLWIYDDDAKRDRKTCYMHQKMIWELRKIIQEIP